MKLIFIFYFVYKLDKYLLWLVKFVNNFLFSPVLQFKIIYN